MSELRQRKGKKKDEDNGELHEMQAKALAELSGEDEADAISSKLEAENAVLRAQIAKLEQARNHQNYLESSGEDEDEEEDEAEMDEAAKAAEALAFAHAVASTLTRFTDTVYV